MGSKREGNEPLVTTSGEGGSERSDERRLERSDSKFVVPHSHITNNPSTRRFPPCHSFDSLGYDGDLNVSIVKVGIETGRTHQIRVHMESLGHPVAGDKVYNKWNGGGVGKGMKDKGRVMLHCWRMEWEEDGKRVSGEAKLDDDIKEIVDRVLGEGWENKC